MKRLFASFLIFILLLSGCSPASEESFEALSSPQVERQEDPAPVTPDSEEEAPVQQDPAPQPPAAESEPKEESKPSSVKKPAPVEEVRMEDAPPLTERVQLTTPHTSVAEGEHYQFSTLSDREKKVYNRIDAAAEQGKTVADLRGLGCSVEQATDIYCAYVSDHPQYFYLYSSFAYTCSGQDGLLKDFVILYFDGKVYDQYGENGELSLAADRAAIGAQIRTFNSKVAEWAALVPVAISLVEKEKVIYDLIQDHVTYATEVAESIAVTDTVESHAFDAYGAICEGEAVCEGYAELFQLLCYCVGIDATPVFGQSEGQDHMWTALRLESGWYMADVTWDDPDMEGYRCYLYFNVTEEQLAKTHNIDRESLSVPSCTAEEDAFYRRFAIYPSSLGALPENYKEILNRLAAGMDTWLYFYFPEVTNEVEIEFYLHRFVLGASSAVRAYLREQDYGLEIDPTYYMMESYCVLKMKRTR